MVNISDFRRAAKEMSKNGENDVLPRSGYEKFIKDNYESLTIIATALQEKYMKDNKSIDFSSFSIWSETLISPSSIYGFRIVNNIHPFWVFFLNGVTFHLLKEFDSKRRPEVMSYRLNSNEQESDDFFERKYSWRKYKETSIAFLQEEEQSDILYVIQCDISNFYEKIYHHRLENAIAEKFQNGTQLAREIDRLLNMFSYGKSFGLPIGQQFSRILSEILMDDIDNEIVDRNIKFFRYVDDFTIFCRTEKECYEIMSQLSSILMNYGLSFNKTKTSISTVKTYIDTTVAQLVPDNNNETNMMLETMDIYFDPYSETAEEDYNRIKQELNATSISEILEDETKKIEPSSMVVARIIRTLSFLDSTDTLMLINTLLSENNLTRLRASWSKIMRGIYKIQTNEKFKDIHALVDEKIDDILFHSEHLLTPDVNRLHFIRLISLKKTEVRSKYILSQLTKENVAVSVKAESLRCITLWGSSRDFNNKIRNKWENFSPIEMLAALPNMKNFGEAYRHNKNLFKKQFLRNSKFGFEEKIEEQIEIVKKRNPETENLEIKKTIAEIYWEQFKNG